MLFKELSAQFVTNWTQKLDHCFNCLAVDSIFKHPGLSLATAAEDGKVYVYEISSFDKLKSSKENLPLKLISEHETKGDALQAMVIHDVTKVHANDLITCDSRGLLTVFCNGQILSRLNLSNESLDCLQVSQEQDGSVTIVAGGDAGLVTGVHPSKELWRLNLLQTPSFGPVSSASVTCIASFDLPSISSCPDSVLATYVFVADSASRIHVLHMGQVVLATQTPSVVNAMTIGNFVTFDEGSRQSLNTSGHFPFGTTDKPDNVQIALGCDNGAIYIMDSFEIVRQPFAKGDYSIEKLLTVPIASAGNASLGGVHRRRSSSSSSVFRHPSGHQQSSVAPTNRIHDALLVGGGFNEICVYHAGRLVTSESTSDWVSSIAPYDVGAATGSDGKDAGRKFGFVVGCLDHTVACVELTLNL